MLVVTIIFVTLVVVLVALASHHQRRHPGHMSAEEAGRDKGLWYDR